MAFEFLPRGQGFSVPFDLAAAAGAIDGIEPFHKFGRNLQGGTADYTVMDWNAAITSRNTYVYQTVPQGVRMASPDNTATHQITATFLDANWDPTVYTGTLTGTTLVNIGTYIRLVNAYTTEPGRTTGILADAVYFVGSGAIAGGTPSAAGMIIGAIPKGANRTQTTVMPVRNGWTYYMTGIWAGISQAAGVSAVAADFSLYVGGTNLPLVDRGDFGMTNLGHSPFHANFDHAPLVIPQHSDIEMRVQCTTTNMKIFGGYYGVLIQS